jgi:SAM-dependent methyltransferase
MLRERKSERSSTNPQWNRLEVNNWDAKDLSKEVKDGEISHIISSYAYYTFRDENVALAEAYRVLQPGGFFVETSMRDTEWAWVPERFLKEVRSDITLPGPGEHWLTIEGVTKTLENAGFKSVQVKEYDVGITWDTYDDFMTFIFEGMPFMKPLIADWSEEEVARAKDGMLNYLQKTHPHEPFISPGKGLVGWATK